MSLSFARIVLGMFLFATPIAVPAPLAANPLKLDWNTSHDGRGVRLETDLGETVFQGTLTGNDLAIETTAFLNGTLTRKLLNLSVDGEHKLGISINVFPCRTRCEWHINLVELPRQNSSAVKSICASRPRASTDRFQKYFFCRSAYQSYLAAGMSCRGEAISALTGWFDAAFKFHADTLEDGIGFFARDREVEAYINDAAAACTADDWRSVTGDRKAYFSAMIRHLDVATLELAGRAEKSLNAGQGDEARAWAELLVDELKKAPPLRDKIPPKDAAYVDAIVARAMKPRTGFTLP